MKAHHTRIKFLFGLLFEPLKEQKKKTKEERKIIREKNKKEINLRKQIWRKQINCYNSDHKNKAKQITRGRIKLNNRFSGCAAHHIDEQHIIHIPIKLHNNYYHNLDNPESMRKINWESFKYLMNEMM